MRAAGHRTAAGLGPLRRIVDRAYTPGPGSSIERRILKGGLWRLGLDCGHVVTLKGSRDPGDRARCFECRGFGPLFAQETITR